MKKNRKLLAEIGIITIGTFILALIFTVVSDLYYTEKVYLTSKDEMIDRDLGNICDDLYDRPWLEWSINYRKEHSDVMDELTPEDLFNKYYDDEFASDSIRCYENELDPNDIRPEFQPYISLDMSVIFSFSLDKQILTNNYSRSYLMEIIDENEAYIIAEGRDNEEAIPNYGKTVEYKASEHSAVKEILEGKLNAESGCIHEVYYEKETGNSYYIGYAPLVVEGKVCCLAVLWHDWSGFRREYNEHVNVKVGIGIAVMLLLNCVMLVILYKVTISPIMKITSGIMEYMNDKDSSAVCKKMGDIRIRNEIGVLSDSFAVMATEIDSYIDEVCNMTAEKERLNAELELASKIQLSALPSTFPAFPERKEFGIFASMTPAKEVGGDFYDFFMIDDDHLALVIADVSGKGVPAALFMMSSKTLINNYAFSCGNPDKILSTVNDHIRKNNADNMFVTVWLGILEISTGKMICSNAGHEYPAIKRADGRFEIMRDEHGLFIGAFPGVRYKNYEIQFEKGDTLFVYTDGVPEATNSKNELFGLERMTDALNDTSAGSYDGSLEGILRTVRTHVDRFVGDAPQFDDLTMLCIRYLGNS